MKTIAIAFGTMAFAAGATAADIYGGFGADPDLAPWQGTYMDAVGVQPGVGDVGSTLRSGTASSGLFKQAAPSRLASDTMRQDPIDIYGGFGGADLQRGF